MKNAEPHIDVGARFVISTLAMCRFIKTRFRQDPLAARAFLAVVVLFAVSSLLPAIDVLGPMQGWETLVVVVQLPFDQQHSSSLGERLYWLLWWLPNLMVLAGLVLLLLGRWRYVAATGITALVAVEAAAFDYRQLEFDFKYYLIGFYVWVASMAALAGIGLWRTFFPRS